MIIIKSYSILAGELRKNGTPQFNSGLPKENCHFLVIPGVKLQWLVLSVLQFSVLSTYGGGDY